MREIVFKAKRLDNGEWLEGGFCQSSDGRTFLVGVSKRGMIDGLEVIPETICQYTGLTDKNGNKIWENDVVWVGGTDRAIVIFSEKYSGYILQPIGDFYFDSPMLVDNVDIIDNIIGNIFDNPELIGEQNG